MKIGRYILASIIAVCAAKYVGTHEKQFSPNCNAEYIDAKVINHNTLTLPTTLLTYEQCNISVSFNSGARQDYFAFAPKDRHTFSIKAKRSGDFVSIYQVYKDEPSHTRVLRVALSRDILHSDGYGDGKCFNAHYEKLCFKSTRDIGYIPHDPQLFDLTVDTAGNIINRVPVKP